MIGVGAAGPLGDAVSRERGPQRLTVVREAAPDQANERAAWIALASVPGIGPIGFAAAVRHFGTATAALRAPAAQVVSQLPRPDPETQEVLTNLQRVGWSRIARRLESAARRAGGSALTALDDGYPDQLARLDGRPPVLYVLGSRQALGHTAVAIVGTRHPSGYGLSAAAEIADEIARAGLTVVSGLAIGIDGRAHVAALEAGGQTVAVLPSPIDRVYPPRHRELAARIVAEGGALVSESPPGRPSGKPDFARRNRIISGLAQATVVVEAPDHSGALLTAAAAIAQGRELYAVPGQIDAAASRGCNRLIADHDAELITSAASLVQRLGLTSRNPHRRHLVATLSEAEGVVLHALLKRSGSIEELGTRSHLPTPALASALTLLEARGLAASHGGVTFHATLAAKQMGHGEAAR